MRASTRKWWTYFIRRGDDGPVKIGRSTNVKSRLAALATSSAEPLHVISVREGDHEGYYHRTLAPHRLCGEWFAPTPDVLAAALAAGTPTVPPSPPKKEEPPPMPRRRHVPLRWVPVRGPDRSSGTLAGWVGDAVIRQALRKS